MSRHKERTVPEQASGISEDEARSALPNNLS